MNYGSQTAPRPPPKPGWRYFLCGVCPLSFRETTRDWMSPSLTLCPKCHEEVHPYQKVKDTSIEVTPTGNLVKCQTEIL